LPADRSEASRTWRQDADQCTGTGREKPRPEYTFGDRAF